ncbi:phosphonoacetate hydrolase [Phyllobacterium zundukense]|uniref:Phosphonoacetate hydrolase n=1 Tax=Phyllobacterium zundukense TaxID=1867719 RepID=A0A2N9VYQ0_9HYPH|nr:phosphonoacetate hydrolase [Phyllobacterium zundukense]ATU95203.1 phosphonoacetate hydrolase [Phyllobacterium zundukense]PIO44618.1 phosphonoacetate hydrolase [Phyllobacterium zundukense]
MLLKSSANPENRPSLHINGRTYRWPVKPVVVVCFDGCDLAYLDAASTAGRIPTIDRMRREGFGSTALAAMPTFTNPNNISIVCGAPPAIHGVSGNYYIDRETGREIMMVDATPMRAETILGRFSQDGARVAIVTAKDKLRKALAYNLQGIAFSAEKAPESTMGEHGIDNVPELMGRSTPDQYSAELSLYVLDAGIKLLAERTPELIYLSLSDYVQHKHAPGTPEADDFMEAVDKRIAALLANGAVVGIVADHGMNDMSTSTGEPNVIYLGDLLDAEYGEGSTRVICPIADPYVRHHGALGGFVRVHLKRQGLAPEQVAAFIRAWPGIEEVLVRADVCRRFELPEDKEGDVAVIGLRGVALGARAVDHDLTALAGERLRSHGGLAEQNVPFILSHPLRADHMERARTSALRNFDIFDFALNGVEV